MKAILLFIVALVTSSFAVASNIENEALNIPVRLSVPDSAKTVKQAVEWVIAPSQYKIVADYPGADQVLNQDAPIFDNNNVVIPIIKAVSLIVGEEKTIIIDHEHKLITFTEVTNELQKN